MFLPRKNYTFTTLLEVVILFYMSICLIMWVMQRHILYHPTDYVLAPVSYGLKDFEDKTLPTIDGLHLHIWEHAARDNYPTILFFHGNGGNLSNRARHFRSLADAGFGVIALDYRGYGMSDGVPSEEGFYSDARTTIDYATKTQHIPLEHIMLYGESIGTGVAVQMATENKAGALVLQSAFTSVEARALERYYWLPVRFLLSDRYDSVSKMPRVHSPLLLMHGEKDSIVPVSDGRTLFTLANEPKQAVYFPQSGHNDMDSASMTEAVTEFARQQKLIKP